MSSTRRRTCIRWLSRRTRPILRFGAIAHMHGSSLRSTGMDFPTPVRASFESTLWADVECIVCDAQQARPLSSIPSTRRRTTGTSLSIFRPHMHSLRSAPAFPTNKRMKTSNMLPADAEIQAGDRGLQEAARPRTAEPACADAARQHAEDPPQGRVREGKSLESINITGMAWDAQRAIYIRRA